MTVLSGTSFIVEVEARTDHAATMRADAIVGRHLSGKPRKTDPEVVRGDVLTTTVLCEKS